MVTPMRRQFTPPAPIGGGGFNPLAAGQKHYGMGRSAPNIGATGAKGGYAARDARAAARREALMRRSQQGGI